MRVSSNIDFYLCIYLLNILSYKKKQNIAFIGRDSKERRRRSPLRRRRSRSPTYRRKSRTRSKSPAMVGPRSRTHTRTPERSRSRSRSPYYNRNKYSSHR